MATARVLLIAEPAARLPFYREVIGSLAEIVASSGAGHLPEELRQDFALILVNLAAPAGDGDALEAARRIRRHPRTYATPLLFIGAAEPGLILADIGGPLDFLPAPVAAADLRTKLQLFVDLQTAHAALIHRHERFLSIMSHELRTPLNAILGWATLLRTGRIDGPTTERALETIERNARAQTTLIDELQDVARIVAGTVQLDLTAVDARQLAQSAVAAVMPAANDRHIILGTEVAPGIPSISADFGRLHQVLCQLLSNAIRVTPDGGEVTLRLAHTAGVLEISVTDTGPGIAADLLPELFDRFRQDEGSTGRRRSGRGLGLTLVRHLVDLHGGTVVVDSPGEGQGATFTVRLGPAVSP